MTSLPSNVKEVDDGTKRNASIGNGLFILLVVDRQYDGRIPLPSNCGAIVMTIASTRRTLDVTVNNVESV